MAIQIIPSSAAENAGAIIFTIIGGTPSTIATVSTFGGSASVGVDYTALSSTGVILDERGSGSVTVYLTDDALFEGTEYFNIIVTDAGTEGQNAAVGTITDDDTAPTLSIAPGTMGAEPGTPQTFTVTLSAASGLDTTVEYSTANGTATAGSDYTATSGQLLILAGQMTGTITVAVADDALFEGSEDFTVTLATPTNATIANGTATGTIADDEVAPTLSIVSATAGNEAGAVAQTFTVTLSAVSAQDVTFTYNTANGTALAGSDFTGATNQTGTILAGQTSTTITVPVTDDAIDEVLQDFTVTLSAAVNATIATASATGTIADNDTAPTFNLGNVTVNEADGTATITVTRVGATQADYTLNYTTANGTATGADFTQTVSSLVFTAGADGATQSFTIPIIQDALDEANETFTVSLTSAGGATVGSASTVTIIDDDLAPTLSIVSATAGNEAGAVAQTFTVTLSAVSAQDVTFTYNTANGTALAGSDFTGATNQTGTILAGQTSTTITVPVTDDTLANEGSESFTVTISAPVNATLGTETATGTIADNDINVAPVIDLNGAATGNAATLSYTENQGATAIALAATVVDPDSANFAGGTLTVSFAANGTASDQLSVLSSSTLQASGGTIFTGTTFIFPGAGPNGPLPMQTFVPGAAIGTYTGGANGTALVVTFTADATPALVQQVTQAVAFSNTSDSPSDDARSVDFVLTDGDGGTSTTSAATINVIATNDPVTLTGGELAAYADTTAFTAFEVATGQIDNDPSANTDVVGTLADADQGDTYTYLLTGAGVTDIMVDGTRVGTILEGPYGQLIVGTNGRYQFAPNADAINGLPTGSNPNQAYTIQVTDGGGTTSSATFTVNATGATDAVQLTGGLLATYNDTGAADVFAVQTGRIDNNSTEVSSGAGQLTGDTGSTYAYVLTGAGVSNSVVNGQTVGSEIAGTYGKLVLATDGRYQYVPNDAAINALTLGTSAGDTFTVQITDSNGSVATNPFTVQVNGATEAQMTLTGGNIATYVDGTGVNQFDLTEGKFDTDVTAANTASTNNNGQQVGSLDGGTGAVSFALTGANVSTVTAGGTVVGTVIENEYGRFTVSTDGRYQFVPNQDTINALPEGVDPTVSYTVRATDAAGSTSTATYTVNLEGAFDPVQLDGGSLGSYADTAALDVFGVIQGRIDSDLTSGTNGAGQLINDADKQLVYVVFNQGQIITALTGDNGEYIGSMIRSEYGSLTLAADGRYEFVPNQAGINALAAGELTQLEFNVVVISARDVSGVLNGTMFPDDGTGSLDAAPFTIDLTGARDTAPVLVGGTLASFDDTDGQNSFGVVQGRFDTDVTDANTSVSNQTENFVGMLEGGTGPVRYALTGAGVTNVISDGTIVGYQATSAYGLLEVSTDGRYQFVPNQAAINSLPEGSHPVADFSVQVTDANGATSIAAYSVNLTGGDDAPGVEGSFTQLTETNAPLSTTGQFEASGLPGDTLTYTHPSNGSGVGKGDATEYFVIYDQKLDSQTTLTDTQVAALGATFTLNAQTGGYSFNIASPDFLDPGQTLRVSYEVEVTNQRGETSSEYVNINVLGTAEQGPAGTAGDDTLNGGVFGDIINGGSGDDIINGNGGNDILRGQSGDDVISGGAGHNTIDGGSGLDTGVLDGNYDDYFIYRTGNTTITIERADDNAPIEVSQFSNVESFQFADQTVAFQDLLGNVPQPAPAAAAELAHAGTIIG